MELEFGGKVVEPQVRRLYDMREVLYDQAWLAGADNFDLYYMYRDLYLSRADKAKLLEWDLRYDITVIPPRMLGSEYIKTAGHYHPAVPGTAVTYPEIYEVLEGEAVYLLQSRDLKDVVAVNAGAGDKVLIPPGYGHITINASNKRLKMSNFVARSFSSIYEPYKEMVGGAFYLTRDGFLANPRYKSPPPLREIQALKSKQLLKLGLSRNKEMYPLILEPETLSYLTKPQDHLDLFLGILG
jgi:glucose-6-phosphate isomerase